MKLESACRVVTGLGAGLRADGRPVQTEQSRSLAAPRVAKPRSQRPRHTVRPGQRQQAHTEVHRVAARESRGKHAQETLGERHTSKHCTSRSRKFSCSFLVAVVMRSSEPQCYELFLNDLGGHRKFDRKWVPSASGLLRVVGASCLSRAKLCGASSAPTIS